MATLEGRTFAAPRLTGLSALVVDNDAESRQSILRLLGEWGAHVSEAESGPRGIAAASRARSAGKPFDLLLVGSAMSSMDGIEFAEHLRRHPTEFAHTILMIDQQRVVRDLYRARAAGIRGHVAKPLLRRAVAGAVTEALNASSEPRPPLAAEPRRRRILVAEDVADVGLVIRSMIEGAAYQVDVAANGSIAVDLYRMCGYDLVLMDLQMPDFDGYQAVRAIRNWERGEGLSRTPIIAVTAYSRDECPDKTFAAGFDGYLQKPFEKVNLLKWIARHLERRPAMS